MQIQCSFIHQQQQQLHQQPPLTHPPSLLIPGPLIVSQGLPGDGMRNTLTEPVPVWRNVIRAHVEGQNLSLNSISNRIHTNSHPDNTAAAAASPHMITTLPSPSATATEDATRIRTSTNSTSANTELVQAMQLWQEEVRSRQIYRYKEWKELWHQQQQQYLQKSSSQDNSDGSSSGWIQMNTSTAWWQDQEGQVAVWNTLPDAAQGKPPKAIAALPPGTAVHATALYEWKGEGAPPRKVLPPPTTTKTTTTTSSSTTTATSTTPCSTIGATALGGSSPRSVLRDDGEQIQTQPTTYTHPWNSLQQQCGTCLMLRIEAPIRGYCVFSLDGYPLLQPGTIEHWAQTSAWYWKVTCPVGAYVREGLELATRHVGTLPYGAVVQVLRQRVNQAGLPRLQIVAHVYNPDTETYQKLQGWCSTALNPLSGQRGAILQPLPLPRPTVYRIVLPQGAVIRQDVELASPVIGHAPYGSWVTVLAQVFSDFPADRAVARLRLAGGGWISTRLNHVPPHDLPVVECVGADAAYDAEQPALFHYAAQQQAVLLQLQAQREQQELEQQQQQVGGGTEGPVTIRIGDNLHHDLHQDGNITSMETDMAHRVGGMTRSSSSEKPTGGTNAGGCYYHPVTPPTLARRIVSNSSPTTHHSETTASLHPAAKPCLCCMENERDATLVHGGTGHIVCCLPCARILQAQGQKCPVCRLDIDLVIKHYFG